MSFKVLYLFYSHSKCKDDLVFKFQTCCAISAPHPNAWSRVWACDPDQDCSNSRETLWNLRGNLTRGLQTGSFLLVSNRSIVRCVTLILPFKRCQGYVWQRQILPLHLISKVNTYLSAYIALYFTHGVCCLLRAILVEFHSSPYRFFSGSPFAFRGSASQMVNGFSSFGASGCVTQPKSSFGCHHAM